MDDWYTVELDTIGTSWYFVYCSWAGPKIFSGLAAQATALASICRDPQADQARCLENVSQHLQQQEAEALAAWRLPGTAQKPWPSPELHGLPAPQHGWGWGWSFSAVNWNGSQYGIYIYIIIIHNIGWTVAGAVWWTDFPNEQGPKPPLICLARVVSYGCLV